jgi:hypothetical protein
VGKPFGRTRMRWKDNIKRDLKETGCEDGRRMELAQGRVRLTLVFVVLNRIPLTIVFIIIIIYYYYYYYTVINSFQFGGRCINYVIPSLGYIILILVNGGRIWYETVVTTLMCDLHSSVTIFSLYSSS